MFIIIQHFEQFRVQWICSVKDNGLGKIFAKYDIRSNLSSRTIRAFFTEPWKFNFGVTVNKCSSSPTLLKKVLNKKRRIKHVA